MANPVLQHKTERLSWKQKIILEKFGNIGSNKSFMDLIPKNKPTFSNINMDDCARYIRIHNKITELLKENQFEPHEIFKMINSYNGSNDNFADFKKLIVSRNICIIKKYFDTAEWKNYINVIVGNAKKKFEPGKAVMDYYNSIENTLIDILEDEIVTYDILQHKIELDSRNVFKKIILTIDNNNKIAEDLIRNGYLKIN